MRNVIRITVFLTMAAMLFGCDMPPTESTQVISGVVAQDTFPSPVTEVRVVSGTTVVNEAQVDVNNAFTLIVPPGKGYQIEFLSSTNGAGLVFPRSAGSVETKFDVAASQSPFDMGAVRYIGDPSARNFLFANLQDENGDAECGQEGEFEGENEDVCVDDDAENEACEDDDDDDGECEQEGENEGENEGCDDDGDDDDGEVEDDDDGVLPSEAAVADKNLPSSLGCGEDDEDDDDVECEQEGEHEGENEGC
jgi:hypothetical protein